MIGWLKTRPTEYRPPENPGGGSKTEGGAIFPDIGEQWLSRLAMILSRMKESRPLTVALVSSVPDEGVSTVAVNLARELYRTFNWRVALVDANLPAPALHRLSPAVSKQGLCEVLRGELAPASAIQLVNEQGLGLMPAGQYQGRELGTLFSRELMVRLSPAIGSGDWDAVILDCPPLLSYPGSTFIAAQADATALVVRGESTRSKVVGKAMENLREANANVIGVVLNRVKFYIPEWLYRLL